eukprot:scaffold31700_cov25-Phaeocystis_antarctica.AAC.2
MSIVIPTSFSEADHTDSTRSEALGSNLAPSIDPKIWLIEATEGRVTFMTWKCLVRVRVGLGVGVGLGVRGREG